LYDGHVLFVRQQGIRKKSCFSSRQYLWFT